MNINKKHLKRVKRKRILERRKKAFGSIASTNKFQRALKTFQSPTVSMASNQPQKNEKEVRPDKPKKGFFRRMFGN